MQTPGLHSLLLSASISFQLNKSYQASSSSTFNGEEFTLLLIQDNIQFHPERTGINGLNLFSLTINHFGGKI
jgi:imidazoleglycerol phosphate synthase glutamine amidotransferase subunit HisH